MIILTHISTAQTKELMANSKHLSDIGGEVFVIECILMVASGFLFLSIVMVIFLIIRRNLHNKSIIRENQLQEKYWEYLSNMISIPYDDIYENIAPNESTHLTRLDKKDLTDKNSRKILLNEIYKIHKQLAGRHAEMIRQLYLGFSMYDDTITLLNSNNWQYIIIGISHVRQFRLSDQLETVRKYLNNKNIDVRCEAIMALLSLSGGRLDFLSDLRIPMTDWERHKIVAFFAASSSDITFDHDKYLQVIPEQLPLLQMLDTLINPEAEYMNSENSKLIMS